MKEKIQQLKAIARQRMKESADPVHDLDHVERVVDYTKEIISSYDLTEKEEEAAILAAWWHDIGRTVTRNTSFILMPFFDDLISAITLWFFTLRYGLFGKVVGISTRIIFCKSIGTGKLLTKFLLTKRSRLLLDIVKDADTIDIIHIERTKRTFKLVEESSIYKMGYKFVVWWYISRGKLKVKTERAKKILDQMIRQFAEWVQQEKVKIWHHNYCGKIWSGKMNKNLKKLAYSSKDYY